MLDHLACIEDRFVSCIFRIPIYKIVNSNYARAINIKNSIKLLI